ncbi:cytochrome P450 family protein [Hypoxylon crocopeplum]|nr:cytochrome P450 family protein [Hypoxylon crocopeplum]
MALASSHILFLLVVGLLAYHLITRFVQWRRLRHIPGPPAAGWSKIWLLRHVVSGRLCTKLEETCNEYGPLVRVGPDWVVCGDSVEIRRIWGLRSGYYRTDWYRATRLNPDEENVLTIVDNKAHHQLRSRLQPAYAGKGMDDREPIVDAQVSNLIALIERKYISTEKVTRPCDLARTMQYLTQDTITAVGFGKALGYLDADKDIYGVIEACEAPLLPVHILAFVPILQKIVSSFLFRPLLPKPTDEGGVGPFLGVIKKFVDERYGGGQEEKTKIRRKDILQSFVDSDLRRSQVESEALVTLFGGTDTTATGLRNTIFFLTANPAAYRALQAEIDSATTTTATRPVIADDHAASLPYLGACIREGLRLWPPSMGVMGKQSDGDDVLCGLRVPAKTKVGWAALAVMKDRRVFGENADVFEPRRWIDADAAQLREMEAVYGLVFATGTRWECLGKKLAYVELRKVIFELFRRYDFAMVTPMEPFQWVNHGLTAQHNMRIRITKRIFPNGEE